MLHDDYGISEGYEDAFHTYRLTSPATRRAIEEAMDIGSLAGLPRDPVVVLTGGKPVAVSGPRVLRLEDGTELKIDGLLPEDVPFGYHDLVDPEGGETTRLIITPGKCVLPPQKHCWGWAAQLYGARSRASWGMGDLADLCTLASWAHGQSASILLINPLNAVSPVVPQEPSPYYPSSRRFRNPLYLRIEHVPGAEEIADELEPLAKAGRALNLDRRINRDEVFRLKFAALEKLWRRFEHDPQFDAFCLSHGDALREFATFCTLSEQFGRDWNLWPAEYRHPRSAAVAEFGRQHTERVRFHTWVQWLIDVQLECAARELPVMQDLPIGADPSGADAWAWQDLLARGIGVGAPPDMYSLDGQDWGLPPFVPQRLRAALYQPFVEIIRANLRHAGGLRIDHVMGLFRLFWVPAGVKASEGTFVYYPADDLLGILALESHRAKAFVVGEDLGTVEDDVRARLAAYQVLSYRLMWFEQHPPEQYPHLALSAITTHDLPTIAGLWTGFDAREQENAGLTPNYEGFQLMRSQLEQVTGLHGQASTEEMVVAAHKALARAPSTVLTATLDDALLVPDRPNMPGTMHQWPNWSIALPKPLEEIVVEPLPQRIAQILSQRSGPTPAKTHSPGSGDREKAHET